LRVGMPDITFHVLSNFALLIIVNLKKNTS